MLDPITLKCFCAAIIHVYRQRDCDCALGIHQALAIIFVDTEVVGNDLELVAGHLKNFVVVNRHETKSGVSARKVQMLFPPEKHRVKCKAAQGMSCSNGSTILSEFVTSPRLMKIETLAVHAGQRVDPATGAVSAPIHLSTTFERDVEGTYSRGFMYTRNNNPNRQALEEGISALEGGASAAAFASGTSATGAIFQALAPGDHVLAHVAASYGTSRLLREIFLRWGLQADFIDMSDLAAVKKALRPKTKLAWMETPSNPLLKIVDLAEDSTIVRYAGALCVCDYTLDPILHRPLCL